MLKIKSPYQRILASVLSILAAMMFSLTADAAACQGKSKTSCSADSSCSWVNSYTRKDGVSVSGHCRAKAGKATTGSKKSADKKKTVKSSKAVKSSNKKDKKKKKDKKVKKSKDKKKKDKKTKNKKSSDKSKK